MNFLTERRKAILFLVLAAMPWSTTGVFVKVCGKGNSYSTKRVSCETLFVLISSFSLSSYRDVPSYQWQLQLPKSKYDSDPSQPPRRRYP